SLEPDDPASLQFLSDFFGTEWRSDQIVPGIPAPVPTINHDEHLPSAPFKLLADKWEEAAGCNADAAYLAISRGMGESNVSLENPLVSMRESLQRKDKGLTPRLLKACSASGSIRAVSLTEFGRSIFGQNEDQTGLITACRGLLIARSMCDQDG